jgi:HK97 family phage portal protein
MLERWGYVSAKQVQAEIEAIKADFKKLPPWVLATAASYEPDGLDKRSTVSNQAELYQRMAWVNIAVSTVANLVAGVELNVKKLRAEKERDIENHPFELLLHKPNPLQSRFEFMRATASDILLTGNAYWHNNAPSEGAPPYELWRIQPSRIYPVTDGRSFISGYMYDPGNGPEIMLENWQVIHFKDYHPSNMFLGLSRVEPIAMDAQTDMNMARWNKELFGENNARLPGIIAFRDEVGEAEWAIIKADIREAAKTRSQMLLRGVGDSVTWMQAAATMRDMEFIEGRIFTKEEVFSIFAPGLSSVLAVNATEANARTGKATLIDFAAWPMLVSIAERITGSLLSAYSGNSKQIVYKAEFEDIRVTDRAMELQEMNAYAQVHTVDEVREKYYESKPLAQVSGVAEDKRGILLPVQINASTGIPGEEPPEPEPAPMIEQPFQNNEKQPDEDPGAQVGEAAEQADEQDERQAALNDDLAKWERKAIKRLKESGAAVCEYTSDIIPLATRGAIKAGLKRAATPEDVRAVFEARAMKLAADPMVMIALELQRANDLLEATANA